MIPILFWGILIKIIKDYVCIINDYEEHQVPIAIPTNFNHKDWIWGEHILNLIPITG
jgi:hypothetical protein